MMKTIRLILWLTAAPFVLSAQLTLTVEIEQLRNNDGKVLLELNNEKEEVIKGYSAVINNNKSIVVIENLSPGKYAFKYFHDENNDEKLNTNFMGIPKEGYGFSNDAKGKFGPPGFDKMIFELNRTDTVFCKPTYLL